MEIAPCSVYFNVTLRLVRFRLFLLAIHFYRFVLIYVSGNIHLQLLFIWMSLMTGLKRNQSPLRYIPIFI
jgi:hypothetical protein